MHDGRQDEKLGELGHEGLEKALGEHDLCITIQNWYASNRIYPVQVLKIFRKRVNKSLLGNGKVEVSFLDYGRSRYSHAVDHAVEWLLIP